MVALTCRNVFAPSRDMDFVKDIVVKVINIRPDARFLVRIDGECNDKGFRRSRWLSSVAYRISCACVLLVNEGVYVSCVG